MNSSPTCLTPPTGSHAYLCRPSLPLGIPLTLQAQSGRPSSRSSLHSSGSTGSYANRRQSQNNYSGAAKGVVVSTSRTGAARSAAILLISCHISALKASKFPSSEHVETAFHNPTIPQPPPPPQPSTSTQSTSTTAPPQLPLTTVEINSDRRSFRRHTNTVESGSLDSESSRLTHRAQNNARQQQLANRQYQDMVMTRYVERQLNHQRQLLTLELPEMLQDRSQSDNDRLKRILGLDDQHLSQQPAPPPPDWRADAQSEDRQWEEEGYYDEDQDHGLRGSAGDLQFDESQQNSKIANSHIEVVEALPSPACDTAKFAVISYTYLCLSLYSSDLSLSHKHENCTQMDFTHDPLLSVPHVVEQSNCRCECAM